MKKFAYLSFGLLLAWTLNPKAFAQQPNNSAGMSAQHSSQIDQSRGSSSSSSSSAALRIGVVNAKKCLEESKLGKQEQANFEKMKKQMESVLQEKEEALKEIEEKLDDDDMLDSLSEEAVSELKRKRRTIRQEGMQLQNQYMQTLQQANVKIIQRLTETIAKASEQVAKNQGADQPIDVIFTDEACTYSSTRLDVTNQVIAKMNEMFNAELNNNPSKQR